MSDKGIEETQTNKKSEKISTAHGVPKRSPI